MTDALDRRVWRCLMTTNYEDRVPESLRKNVSAKLDAWVAEGRNSNTIEGLVQSLVLEAYLWKWPAAYSADDPCRPECAGVVGGPGCDCTL